MHHITRGTRSPSYKGNEVFPKKTETQQSREEDGDGDFGDWTKTGISKVIADRTVHVP